MRILDLLIDAVHFAELAGIVMGTERCMVLPGTCRSDWKPCVLTAPHGIALS